MRTKWCNANNHRWPLNKSSNCNCSCRLYYTWHIRLYCLCHTRFIDRSNRLCAENGLVFLWLQLFQQKDNLLERIDEANLRFKHCIYLCSHIRATWHKHGCGGLLSCLDSVFKLICYCLKHHCLCKPWCPGFSSVLA